MSEISNEIKTTWWCSNHVVIKRKIVVKNKDVRFIALEKTKTNDGHKECDQELWSHWLPIIPTASSFISSAAGVVWPSSFIDITLIAMPITIEIIISLKKGSKLNRSSFLYTWVAGHVIVLSYRIIENRMRYWRI